MNYELIFDTAEQGYTTWTMAVVGLAWIGIPLLHLALERRWPRLMRRQPATRPLLYVAIFVGILWVPIAFVSTYREYTHLSRALRGGRYDLVEGPITSYVAGQQQGRGRVDRFAVANRWYVCGGGSPSASFNQTQAEGSPIHVGSYVRIWDVDGRIVRLQVAR